MKNTIELPQRSGREPRMEFRGFDEFRVMQTDQIGALISVCREIRNRHLRTPAAIEFPDQHAANKSSPARHKDTLVLPILIREGHKCFQDCHGAGIQAIGTRSAWKKHRSCRLELSHSLR